MGYLKNLQGERFGRLTVLKYAGDNKRHDSLWVCECDCGKITNPIPNSSLQSGNTRSCGCLFVDSHTKHGLKNTRLYSVWQGMKARCYRKSHPHYKIYGGRGITICREWQNDFQAFYDWAMSYGYADDLTIDRIDVNGNYEPDNCRWVTVQAQLNNRRNTTFVEINGQIKSLSQWADFAGLKYYTVRQRFKKGVRGADLIKAIDEKKSHPRS